MRHRVEAGFASIAALSLLAVTPAQPSIARTPKSVAVSLSVKDVQPKGVDVVVDRLGLRVSLPRASWQDPTREPLSDRDFMALIPLDFQDGVIEVEVKGALDPAAPAFARGFVGIAFRISDGQFEKIYLRPTNGIAEDMVRRNHSVQYAAYPDWRFDRLRREFPEKYETAADIAPDRWVHMRIEVSGTGERRAKGAWSSTSDRHLTPPPAFRNSSTATTRASKPHAAKARTSPRLAPFMNTCSPIRSALHAKAIASESSTAIRFSGAILCSNAR